MVKLYALPLLFSVFQSWHGEACIPLQPSSNTTFMNLPTSDEITCIATFRTIAEYLVNQFCQPKGKGGAYLLQGKEKTSVHDTFVCHEANRGLLQTALRLAYPIKMTMEAQQVMTTWSDHFSKSVTSWYHGGYPDGITTIRPLTGSNVEIQLLLKNGDHDQAVTIVYGRNPIGEEGMPLFKKDDSSRFKSTFFSFAKEIVDDFYQKTFEHPEVTMLYNNPDNQARLRKAFWLALPAIMTVEENRRLNGQWPEPLNGLSWYVPQTPGLQNLSLMESQYLEIRLLVWDENHQEKAISILLDYGGKAPTSTDSILYLRGKE